MAVDCWVAVMWLILELLMLAGVAAWALLMIIVWVESDPDIHRDIEDDETKR